MQIFLPLILVAAFIMLLFLVSGSEPFPGRRQAVIYAALLSGAYQVFSLEALSLLRGVTAWGLFLAWSALVLALLWWGRGRLRAGWMNWRIRFTIPKLSFAWIPALVVGFALLVTLLVTLWVALVAPPQSWDSLTYHLSRVAHWAQNGSVAHYASGIERQNSMSPGAEFQVLALYVLSGGDRLANLPAWMALLGSVVAVSLAAAYLGAAPPGQWAAAGFAATLPMALAQASSASTDLVVSFCGLCVAVQVLAYHKNSRPSELLYAALALGLAALTKPTIVPYLLPFLPWAGWVFLRREGLGRSIRWGALAAGVVLLVNAGYLGRNLSTYGHFSNPVDFEIHSNENRTPLGVASVLLKNLGTHAALPGQPAWNLQVYRLIVGLHFKAGMDINDPRTSADGEYRLFDASPIYEDRITNPYHAYLALASFGAALFFLPRLGRPWLAYALALAGGLVLFSLFYKWNAFGMRYHLPFFLLLAPAVGVVLGCIRSPRLGGVLVCLVVLGLLAGSWPAFFSLRERPLIQQADPPIPSILRQPRLELYFAAAGERSVYQKVTQPILDSGCRRVGLVLLGEDPEYLFWVLLGAPRPDLQVEWIVGGAPSAQYRSADFTPCAVICRGCPAAQREYNSLPLFSDGLYRLYLQP
jgi:hypothetical protein